MIDRVLAAIDLDDKAVFQAIEIDDIGADRLLAAEFHASQLTIPQVTPEQFLGFRGPLP